MIPIDSVTDSATDARPSQWLLFSRSLKRFNLSLFSYWGFEIKIRLALHLVDTVAKTDRRLQFAWWHVHAVLEWVTTDLTRVVFGKARCLFWSFGWRSFSHSLVHSINRSSIPSNPKKSVGLVVGHRLAVSCDYDTHSVCLSVRPSQSLSVSVVGLINGFTEVVPTNSLSLNQ